MVVWALICCHTVLPYMRHASGMHMESEPKFGSNAESANAVEEADAEVEAQVVSAAASSNDPFEVCLKKEHDSSLNANLSCSQLCMLFELKFELLPGLIIALPGSVVCMYLVTLYIY